MGKEISLFNDYSIKENILSNHCGVILKLLYEENPKGFEEVISTLSSTDFVINPSFEQQIQKSKSIPDIVIEQKSFSIFFETKKFDWFYDNQIKRHLKSFELKNDYNILFLLSNFEEDSPEDKFYQQILEAKKEFNVTLCPVSFEALIGAIESIDLSDIYKKYLNEFNEFLDRNGYLPTWKDFLDVVNCASTINEVHDQNVYMCPNTGGKYKHKRAKYFGGYKSKNIKFIHEIKGLVIVERNQEDAFVKWKNVEISDIELINEAKKKIQEIPLRTKEIRERSLQVFLLHNAFECNFRKVSSGGLYSSKKYMKSIGKKYGAKNSQELAKALYGKTWE